MIDHVFLYRKILNNVKRKLSSCKLKNMAMKYYLLALNSCQFFFETNYRGHAFYNDFMCI